MKYLLILFVTCCAFSASSEILPTFSIVQLAIFSNQIVEAQFIEERDGKFYFLTRNISDPNTFNDTLVTGSLASFEYLDDADAGFKNTDQIMLFLSSSDSYSSEVTETYPVLSGVRLFRDEQLYLPVQRDNPGGMYFVGFRDSLSWSELKSRVINVQERINQVKSLKEIQGPFEKNQALFSWLEKHRDTFWDDCSFNGDCGWGSLTWEIFDWITSNNIGQDTWRAFELCMEMRATSKGPWINKSENLQDMNGTSFKTNEDIEFLISIAMDIKKDIVYRRQALAYLGKAKKTIYGKNYPLPDSISLSILAKKQKEIRDTIFTLMDDPLLRGAAFGVVSNLSNPRDGALKHRIDLALLPAIIEIYKKEEFSNFKTALANFIVYNTSEEEWKSLTGNDAKIFMEISKYFQVDTLKNRFRFGFHYRNGRAIIKAWPTVYFQAIDTPGVPLVWKLDDSNFKLPYEYHYNNRTLKYDISNFKKGAYSFWIEGTAGEKNEFKWKSEIGNFKIE